MATNFATTSEFDMMNHDQHAAMKYALNTLGREPAELKDGQKRAIRAFFSGKDTMVVLPTGYGKSLVYQVAPLCADFLQHVKDCGCNDVSHIQHHNIAVVISPLIALMADQVKQMGSKGITAMNISAAKTTSEKLKLSEGKYSIVFATPESLMKSGMGILHTSVYRQNVCGIFVDEGHCIAKWGFKDGKVAAFRKTYSRLAELRALLQSGTPMFCLTATASPSVSSIIISSLGLEDFVTIKESPERDNIRYSVVHVEENIDGQFKWLEDNLNKSQEKLPKTIVFCKLKKNCSIIHSALTDNNSSLEKYVGIFHADTPPRRKTEIIDDFTKSQSTIRILLATSAFGMGINVRNLHTVVHYGPSRDVDDYFQESGRVGRDGKQSFAVLMNFKGRGKGIVRKSMKDYVKSTMTCRRKELLAHYGESIAKPVVPHNCCDICSFECQCGDGMCQVGGGAGWAEQSIAAQISTVKDTHKKYHRSVTEDERVIVKGLLLEYQQSLVDHEGQDGLYSGTSITSGFPTQLIELLVKELHTIGGISDLTHRFPFFNITHVSKVWNIVDQICEEIVEELTTSIPSETDNSDSSSESLSLSDLESDEYEHQQEVIKSHYSRITLDTSSSSED